MPSQRRGEILRALFNHPPPINHQGGAELEEIRHNSASHHHHPTFVDSGTNNNLSGYDYLEEIKSRAAQLSAIHSEVDYSTRVRDFNDDESDIELIEDSARDHYQSLVTDFKNQRLRAWQPILTAGVVLKLLFGVGVIFIPIGAVLLVTSSKIKEREFEYTSCQGPGGKDCGQMLEDERGSECNCEVKFEIDEDMTAPVFFYYGLSNYFQNHRRFAGSRDEDQLRGARDRRPSKECEPFRFTATNENSAPIVPCGVLANSLFNDTFTLQSSSQTVPLSYDDIAWPTDKTYFFRNPGESLETWYKDFTHPPNWKYNIWNIENMMPGKRGFENEGLMVWLRAGAFPSFRKLYARIDHEKSPFQSGLPKGQYTVRIAYRK